MRSAVPLPCFFDVVGSLIVAGQGRRASQQGLKASQRGEGWTYGGTYGRTDVQTNRMSPHSTLPLPKKEEKRKRQGGSEKKKRRKCEDEKEGVRNRKGGSQKKNRRK